MTKILALDTSSDACSVALLTPEGVQEDFRLASREHTRLIMPMIDGLLANAGLNVSDLDAIAFGRGPGSFTGLRIAAGVVQGLAWGAELPVVPVSTLAAMALEASRKHGAQWVFPVLDARMDEVYAALYRVEQGALTQVVHECVCKPEDLLSNTDVRFEGGVAVVGSGLHYEERFPDSLKAVTVARIPDLQPRAGAIAALAEKAYLQGHTVKPEEVQPVYLRDEVAWNKLPGR